ncbi:Fructose import ATP-binding protein FruK [Baekduia alba]|uniref:sugar ABC transporter ATP-binding protein n=1 Tax=Baekduia alba TaxID=2997333 RepID=UPI0023408C10|nr:sugar ABC transporter ATP-binding protein [Baekduia alba]WCB91725.1 Fructose import ATP-binding protein FruK [Baekduia alba]
MHVLDDARAGASATGRRPLLTVRSVSRRFGAITALNGVSLTIAEGEILGLCGHNGAGKSTLVKVLTGLVSPDGGEIALDGEVVALRGPRDAQAAGIALVDQELSIICELTVAENLLLGDISTALLTRRAARRRLCVELLERVGLGAVDPDQPAAWLTLAERQLLEIGRALHRNARLLILDEPTATLSKAEIDRVFAAVREVASRGRAVIFISHRLDEVLTLCDRATVMRDGAVVADHAVGELDRARLVRLLVGEAGHIGPAASARRVEPAQRRVALTARRLVVAPVVADVGLDLFAGEVVGLAGQIGSGTQDVLRALAGVEPSATGDVSVGDQPLTLGTPHGSIRAGVAYVSGDRKGEGLFLGQSIAQNLLATRLDTLGRGGVLSGRGLTAAARALATTVGVDAARTAHAVETLSGGNQQKVFIGRCLDQEGIDVLLLDDPTRGVDVGGRADIHALVRGFADAGGAVLFASSELDELFDLADVIVTMFEGAVVAVRPRAACVASGVLTEMTTGCVAGEAPS